MTKPTHSPLRLELDQAWPFNIKLRTDDRIYVTVPREAYSSQSKTIDDVMLGIGFSYAERHDVIDRNETQLKFWENVVRSVNSHAQLVKALEELLLIVESQPWGSKWPGRPHAQCDAARAALAAAKVPS